MITYAHDAFSFHASLPGSSFTLGPEHVEFSLRGNRLCCFNFLFEKFLVKPGLKNRILVARLKFAAVKLFLHFKSVFL